MADAVHPVAGLVDLGHRAFRAEVLHGGCDLRQARAAERLTDYAVHSCRGATYIALAELAIDVLTQREERSSEVVRLLVALQVSAFEVVEDRSGAKYRQVSSRRPASSSRRPVRTPRRTSLAVRYPCSPSRSGAARPISRSSSSRGFCYCAQSGYSLRRATAVNASRHDLFAKDPSFHVLRLPVLSPADRGRAPGSTPRSGSRARAASRGSWSCRRRWRPRGRRSTPARW